MALILLIVLAALFPGGDSSPYRTANATYSLYRQAGTLIFLDWDDGSLLEFGEFGDGDYAVSMDGATYAVREKAGGTLWYFTASEKTRIADDVTAYLLSDSGAGVVYLAGDSDHGDSGSLFHFNPAAGSSVKIADNALEQGLAVSPDGQTVTYVNEENLCFLHAVSSGETAVLGEEIVPIALADGAEYIYYESEYGLYVRKDGEDTTLCSYTSWFFPMTFNADYSQVVFGYSDRVYISRNGGNRKRLSNTLWLNFSAPIGTQHALRSIPAHRYGFLYSVIGVDDFAGQVFCDAERIIWRLEEDLSATMLGEMADIYPTPTRGGTLYFIDQKNNLSRCDLTADESAAQILMGNVEDFAVSWDGSQLFYVSLDGHLFHYRGSDSVLIDTAPAAMWASSNGVFYTLPGDDSLYYSLAGAEPIVIDRVEDISLIRMWNGVCYHPAGQASYDIYYTDGGEPRLVAESCSNL